MTTTATDSDQLADRGAGRLPLRRSVCALWVYVLLAWTLPVFHFDWWTPRFAAVLFATPLGAWLLVAAARRREVAPTAAVALIAWVIIGSLLSSNPSLSLLGGVERSYSAVLLLGSLGGWAIARRLDGDAHLGLEIGLFSALVVNALIGSLQITVGIDDGLLASSPSRASGALVNPVFLGAVAAAGAAYAARRIAEGPAWPAAFTATGAYLVVLSGSRVALAALVVATVLSAVVAPGSRRRLLIAGSTVAGAAIGLLVGRVGGARTSLDRIGGGTEGRTELWGQAIGAATDRPLFGTGLGLFRDAVQGDFGIEFARESNQLGQQPWSDPHNVVVLLLVSLGVVGLGLATWFVAAAVRQTGGPFQLAFLVLAGTWLLQPAPIQTLPVALVFLGAAFRHDLPTERAGSRSLDRTLLMALLGTGAVLAGYVALADLRLDRALSSRQPDAVESAAAWYFRDANVEATVAGWYAASSDSDPSALTEAVRHAALAARYDRTRPIRWVDLARLEAASGDWASAKTHFERAVELEPTELGGWLGLVEAAAALNDDELAALASDRACALIPSCREPDG